MVTEEEKESIPAKNKSLAKKINPSQEDFRVD